MAAKNYFDNQGKIQGKKGKIKEIYKKIQKWLQKIIVFRRDDSNYILF